MADIDYALLAEYVRQDSGLTHVMGAGFDTVTVPAEGLPVAVPVGLAARISFDSQDPVGADHQLTFVFRGPDDEDIMILGHRFQTPEHPPEVPEHWRMGVGVALRLGLLFPRHGGYTLQVMLDDDPRISRTLFVRAVPPPTTSASGSDA